MVPPLLAGVNFCEVSRIGHPRRSERDTREKINGPGLVGGPKEDFTQCRSCCAVVVSGVLERVQQVSFIGNILRITSCKQNHPRIDALR